MTHEARIVAAAVALTAFLVGCSSVTASDSAPGAPSDAGAADARSDADQKEQTPSFQVGNVTYAKSCRQTAASACNSRCADCWSTCEEAAFASGSVDCVESCNRICDCSTTDPSKCLTWTHVFDLGPPDPTLQQACEDMNSALRAHCQRQFDEGLCSSFARAERPECSRLYACTAAEIRGGKCEGENLDCALPPTDQGTKLCAQATSQCGSCPLDVRGVDEEAGWLRDDVRNAAWKCLELSSCSDVSGCLDAWQRCALAGL